MCESPWAGESGSVLLQLQSRDGSDADGKLARHRTVPLRERRVNAHRSFMTDGFAEAESNTQVIQSCSALCDEIERGSSRSCGGRWSIVPNSFSADVSRQLGLGQHPHNARGRVRLRLCEHFISALFLAQMSGFSTRFTAHTYSEPAPGRCLQGKRYDLTA